MIVEALTETVLIMMRFFYLNVLQGYTRRQRIQPHTSKARR